jgi:hypothetical protein
VYLPCTIRLKEEGLSHDGCLAGEPSGGSILFGSGWRPITFDVKIEAGQCNVSVSKVVDKGESVVLENLSSFAGGLASYNEQMDVGAFCCLMNKLPGRSCVHTAFRFNGKGCAGSRESKDGVGPVIPRLLGLAAGHHQPWDVA